VIIIYAGKLNGMGWITPDSCCVNMLGIRGFSLDPFVRERRVWGALSLRARTSRTQRWGVLGRLDRPYSVWRDTLTRMECVLRLKLSFAVKEGYGQPQQVQPEKQFSTCILGPSLLRPDQLHCFSRSPALILTKPSCSKLD